MTTKSATAKPKNDAFATIHSAAKGLHRGGVINKTTMREYDGLWETGQKRPSGMALRLLHVVEKHGLEVLA